MNINREYVIESIILFDAEVESSGIRYEIISRMLVDRSAKCEDIGLYHNNLDLYLRANVVVCFIEATDHIRVRAWYFRHWLRNRDFQIILPDFFIGFTESADILLRSLN